MTTLEEAAELGQSDSGLAVVATLRADGTIQSSVVNAGLFEHPMTGQPVIAFVTYGPVKLANLRERPKMTVTFRSGWRWAAIEGRAELAGPDDPQAWLDDEGLRVLLRAIFKSAGGNHDHWDEYDRVMAADRRTAVFVSPDRVYSNRSAN
jgi:PPOX class probable F420-dependent enzyme